MDIQQILMGKPNALDYATQTDQSALQRKRRMVQMLLQSAMERSSPTIDAGAYKVANWGDALGRIFEAYAAKQGGDDLTKEEQALAREQLQRHSRAAAQFAKDANGYTFEPQGPMPDGGSMPPQEVKGDLTRALMGAMQSGDPQMQALAEKGLLEKFKKIAGETDLMPKQHVIDGRLVAGDAATGQVVANTPAAQYGAPIPATPNMPAYAVESGTNKPLTMGQGQLAPGVQFNKELEGNDVKTLAAGKEKAGTAWDGLKLVSTMNYMIDRMAPESFGRLSDLKAWANQMFSSLGLPGVPDGAKIETINSLLGERLLERLRMFAPVSNSDADKMKMIAGSATNTKEGLQGILNYAEKVFARGINSTNQFAEDLERDRPDYGNLDRYKSYRFVVGDTDVLPQGVPTQPVNLKKYWKK